MIGRPQMNLAASLAILFAGATFASARAGGAGTELPFAAGTGARMSAMGLAGASLHDSPSLMALNPATLAAQRYRSVEFYRTTLFDSDSRYHALSYAHPTLGTSAFGVSILRLDVSDIESRDALNNLLGTIHDAQTRLLFGYAVSVVPSLALGADLKIDNHRLGGFSGTGVGVDAGARVRHLLSPTSVFQELRGGLAVENLIEPTVKLVQDDVPDPVRVSIGASLLSRYADVDFTTALDLVSPRYTPTTVRFGQEIRYAGMFAARFGVDGSSPTLGVGVSYHGISLDYAWRSEDLGNNHRFSVTFAIGKPVEQRIAQKRRSEDVAARARIEKRISTLETRQVSRLISTGDSLYAAGDFAGAARRYEMAGEWDPTRKGVRDRLRDARYHGAMGEGDSKRTTNDFSGALYYYRLASRIVPGDTTAHGRIDACEKSLALASAHKQSIDRMVRSAIDLYAEGHYNKATAAFDEILRVAPTNEIAREYRYKSQTNISNAVNRSLLHARRLAEHGDYQSAVRSLATLSTQHPGDKRLTSALDDLRRKEENALGSGQSAQGTVPATRRAPVHRASKQPNPSPPANARALDAQIDKGLAALEAGRFDTAAHLLNGVWQVAPTYRNVAEPLTRAWLFMGMREYSAQRFDNAIRTWERILTVDPGNAKALRYLQKTREETGRLSAVEP